MADVLQQFSPATREWFRASFAAPTAAQEGAWAAISSGSHTLVVAPTGSGKTLSAFLWALDRLSTTPVPQETQRCRVLYISPLKALAVDIERNLRSPLVGIGHAATRLGLGTPQVEVAVRSGDTTPQERRAFSRRPTDILITTPESLFLLLTSKAREALAGVETVIIDEIHALAGTKRGAHLAVSLDRLDALLPTPAQRIGLSATVRPLPEVARYLAGGRQVEIVDPVSTKQWQLDVVVPVEDMSSLGQVTEDLSGSAAGARERTSIWPHVEERLVDLVTQQRSTLIFANSRRLAERLTTRLNEIWQERLAAGQPQEAASPKPAPAQPPAEVMAAAGSSAGAPAVLARAHHGSVSREQRAQIETGLKSGTLPAVVATSSLELGIDMGAIDLVAQVESPPSVAGGLQRVGRAGHRVGAVSHGVFFPKYRGDLVQTAVVVERMRAGQIEALHVPANPLDVLAQQVVAMAAMDEWGVGELLALLRRSAPFADLSRTVLDSVLDMLAGRYPSEEFAELRPRLVWDRLSDTLTGRPGAQRLAVTSGGTIPDRGLFGVFLAGEGPGRRVGELDEEMVYESRVGDVFTLGTSSWRIEDITHDQVFVSPAPGQPGKLPFWKGDTLGRPAELGAAVGAFVREVSSANPKAARKRVREAGLDEWAATNLLTYLQEQKEATAQVPSDRTIVLERFRDEIGDWQIAIHSPFGSQLHAPWALVIAARMRQRFGIEVQAMHGDDGIVLRLPDMEFEEGSDLGDLGTIADLCLIDPEDVADLVTAEVGSSALFASRFRECAGRALLLPRRNPGRRAALWQQRQRAAALLEVATRYPEFPIVLEAVRECLQDVFDVPALVELMRSIASRQVNIVALDTPTPSPFARSLLFGYVAQFLYEGDSPLAERRAAALALDPTLLAELLGRADGAALRDLLDPEVIARTELELQGRDPEMACRHAEDVADLVRRLGPLSGAEVLARTQPEHHQQVPEWLTGLQSARRLIEVRIGGELRWAAVEDAARLRDALGTALPVGLPDAFLEPVTDPLGDIAARFARRRGPFTAQDFATRFGLGQAVARDALRRLVSAGRLVEGELRPNETTVDFCDADVLRTLRRRSLAALRAEVEPVTTTDLARFLPAWQGVGTGSLRGLDGLIRAVEQLCGARLPASAVESLVLPARVERYSPALLDEALAAGEITWQGHGALPGDDGWVSLHLTDTAPLTLSAPGEDPLTEREQSIVEAMAGGGAYFFRGLGQATGSTDDAELLEAVWSLVWAGRLSNDTFAPVRALLAGGHSAHKPRRSAPRTARLPRRGVGALGSRPRFARPDMPTRSGPARGAGRWTLLPPILTDPTARGLATAEVLLDRHGVLTRGAVVAEGAPGGFAALYRVLRAAEDAGGVRRGYFVEHLGASQFASAAAVDRLRTASGAGVRERTEQEPIRALVLAATDPANPYGAALAWPPRPLEDAEGGKHRPARKAGALVVLHDGDLVLYVERGGRTLLTWSQDPVVLAAAAQGLAQAVQAGALGRLTVSKVDGAAVLGSHSALAAALEEAGFHATPRGLRIRRA
ncbi:ATP-dependent helicase [Gephyromycinifex aptenodytis]|uniref:ATP-dependent helicase n=1 Tax=Gephyromycinifex aptenodytis TaxID=2716227 RepID=UPI0014487868|nr:ATP-dependent helicase [Gephyromycinifex aptenodytis]